MNSSPMILRFVSGSSTPARRSRKRSAASTWIERDAEPVAEGLDHLLGLVLAHHPVVDEDAGEPVADRAVDQQRGGRRVDAAGEAADRARLADLGADRLDLLVDHRGRRPALLAAGDVAQEAGQDLGAVRGVDDLGVELDPVEARARCPRRRRPATRGWRRAPSKPGRRLEDGVAVAHPALLLGRQARRAACRRRR